MVSTRHPLRARSDAELAFVVMRALAAARLLWSRNGALPVDALASLVSAPANEVTRALDGLYAEGIAESGAGDATVRLTERAARELGHIAASSDIGP
jgi:DNA-binding IclR family transcriptional regulator